MSDRYTIEKLDIKKHGNGLYNLWQAVSSKYPGGIYWYHGDTNKQWENAFVCLDGDKLIGAVMVDQDGDDIPEIESVAVLGQYRGKHYAKIMVGRVMDLLSKKGCEKVKLTVFTSNEPAIGLYRSLGFEIDKEEKRFMKYI